ncbi:MAG: hypothetical protein RI957_134 [Verrucomicrobiota bacterium]|jgi:Mg-chelatase subunit ChlD
MNEEYSHLSAMGDEATEAKIIAWVLGEASAFEAAELESLCTEHPEWRVFQRRMLALHDCLKDAHATETSTEWKLSAEKRRKLDEVMGASEPAPQSIKRPRRMVWHAISGLAALLVLFLVVTALMTGEATTSPRVVIETMKRMREAEMDDFSDPVIAAEPMRRTLRESNKMDPFAANSIDGAGDYGRKELATQAAKPVMAYRPSSVTLSQTQTAEADAQYGAPADHDGEVLATTGKQSDIAAAAVGTSLQLAQGLADLGQFDESKKVYEEGLRANPNDADARRGLEKVTDASQDYYRASYDHTRAEMLAGVDKTWELSAPDEKARESGKESATPSPSVVDVRFAGKNRGFVSMRKSESLQKLLDHKVLEKSANSPEKQATAAVLPTNPELSASLEPYSTFSLRVSDNSFRIAQAAMMQKQRPAAESVRVEEFYNAFDYGDPLPAAREPVSASMEQSAHPILPQRQLLRIALRTASAGRSIGQPLNITLLVDQSGSMSRGDRHATLLASVKELGTLLQAQDRVSVIGFSRTPRLLGEKIPGNEAPRVGELLARIPSDGGTNLEEALKLAEVIARRNQLPLTQNRILLMTDGAANLGNADPIRLSEWVKELRQKNIAFDIAGIGTDGLNDALLVDLARHGNGRYYIMNDAAQAKQQFATQLAGAFRPAAENVKVQVQFNPRRVGRYQLIGFEKDRLRQEDFRNDRVDAAEMAAAEAGQALYQVELLPDGMGDIGEVSVRFRDANTQQMMERNWTIRHEASAPTFDRASPTLQLAGLAMLTAQKLQGGEGSSLVRFADVEEACRRVRENFSSSQRVSELLEMIQQLQD